MQGKTLLGAMVCVAMLGLAAGCGDDGGSTNTPRAATGDQDGQGGQGSGGTAVTGSGGSGTTGSAGASAGTGGGIPAGLEDAAADGNLSVDEVRALLPTLDEEAVAFVVCLTEDQMRTLRACTVEADADCEQRYTASMTGACSAEARALAECKVMTSNWVCFDELSPYAPYVYAPECADRYSANAACDEG